MTNIANTPTPPYYSVIFTSILKPDETGYEEMADTMLSLAKAQPGFLGAESVREGIGITVSYWDSLESIHLWKKNTSHLKAQELGKTLWYQQYRVRIAKVERDYSFDAEE